MKQPFPHFLKDIGTQNWASGLTCTR